MKLIDRFKILSTILLLMALFLVAISLLSGIKTLAEIKLFYDGVVSFKADHDIISFDNGVIGLIYDTSACPGCKDTLPEWRYIGDLLIDSIVYLDSVIVYDDSTKLNDITINSAGLLNVLKDANAYKLIQRAPWFDPADTLYWDPIFHEYKILNDLSIHYKFYFNDTLSIDTVRSWLHNVSDIQGTGGIPISFED